MAHSKWTTFLLILLAAAILALAAWQIEPIQKQREVYDFEPRNPYMDEQVAAEFRLPLPALFIFRSLAINYLWMRADDLKNAGQYFDALHLARLICALQPNLASVWDFQAWNMAYNISVAVPTAPERWNWVRAGFELLRDEGIPANPNNAELYKSLGWIFQHKIGGISDDYHRYYKQRLAFDLTPLLGGGSHQEIEALARCPRDWQSLLKDAPVADLVSGLKDVDEELDSDAEVMKALLDVQFNPDKYSADFITFLQQNSQTETFGKLSRFIRARSLRQDWGLDPNMMVQLNRKYGPIDYEHDGQRLGLDWRHPGSHSLYWARKGLALDNQDKMDSFIRLSLNRMVYHSLQMLFHYGRIQLIVFQAPPQASERQQGQEIIDKPQPEQMQIEIFQSQDLRMFPIAYQATLDLLAYLEEAGENTKGVLDGSINLARAGILQLYLAGYQKPAQKYLLQLKARYPDREIFQVDTVDIFVRNQLREIIATDDISSKQARNFIDGLLRDGFRYYALSDDENAKVRNQWAEQIYEVFIKEYPDQDNRLDIPFDKLRWIALNNFLSDALVPPMIKSLLLQRLELEKPQLYQRLMKQFEDRQKTSEVQ